MVRKIFVGFNRKSAALAKVGEKYLKQGRSKVIANKNIVSLAWNSPQRKDYFELRLRNASISNMVYSKPSFDKVLTISSRPKTSKVPSFHACPNEIKQFSILIRANHEACIKAVPDDINDTINNVRIEVLSVTPLLKRSFSLSTGELLLNGTGILSGCVTPVAYDRLVMIGLRINKCTTISLYDSGSGFPIETLFKPLQEFSASSIDMQLLYSNPLKLIIPVVKNTSFSINIHAPNDIWAQWNLTLLEVGLGKTPLFVEQKGTEDVSLLVEASSVNRLFNLSIDSVSSQNDFATVWITPSNLGVKMYLASDYMIKRKYFTSNNSGFVTFTVDANKASSLKLTRRDFPSRNGELKITGGNINYLVNWSSNDFFIKIPAENSLTTYRLSVLSTDTHLGDGPYIGPSQMFPMSRSPSLNTGNPFPTAWMKYQSGGEWVLVSSGWEYHIKNMKLSNFKPSSPMSVSIPTASYTATDSVSKKTVTVTNADLNIADIFSLSVTPSGGTSVEIFSNVWDSNRSFIGIDDIQSFYGGINGARGYSAIYDYKGKGVWEHVTYASLYFTSGTSYGIYVTQAPTRFSFVSRPLIVGSYDSEPLPLSPFPFTEYSTRPIPDAIGGRFYSGVWKYSGRLFVTRGILVSHDDPATAWTNTGLNPPIIPRPVIQDNIGGIDAFLSGLATF